MLLHCQWPMPFVDEDKCSALKMMFGYEIYMQSRTRSRSTQSYENHACSAARIHAAECVNNRPANECASYLRSIR